jgi:protein-S-isoprenylcysteine O-methyltransferase Ste14
VALREDMERQGSFLFKTRSYIFVFILPFFLLALGQSGNFQHFYGKTIAALWEILCVGIAFLGLAFRASVAGYVPRGTSGRNTQTQVADTLNTKGVYSLVRNPLYLANFFMALGILLFIKVWWLVIVGVIGFLLYYERIVFAEEEFLRKKFANTYLEWALKTPIFLPRFKNWQKPDLRFSFKTVLRREHSTFFSLVASFTFLHIALSSLAHKKFTIDFGWALFFVIGLIIYFGLRILKKKTTLLNVEGR